MHHCLKCNDSTIRHSLKEEQRKDKNKRIREYRKNPIKKFADNLRSRIWIAFNKISKNNNIKIKGCFRNLDYTPIELYNYLENTRKLQENKCPMCQTDYKNCTVSIDHVIPLERAKTEQEIIDLFCLQNLNLMCKSCNSSKSDTDYKIWMENKCV